MTPPANLDLSEELSSNEFRVSIFGSARIKEESPIYKDAYQLAYDLAEMEVDVITGGGPGIMEAASTGHKDGDKEGKVHSIGLNIKLPFEQHNNPGLEEMDMHERFSTRLDEFMLLSSVVVVMPGGIGTCLELFYTWQLVQVKHICHIPIILVGEMWENLIKWVIDNPLKHGYLDRADLDGVILVKDGEEALEMIKKAKKQFDEHGDTCSNWDVYGKKFTAEEVEELAD